jgi:hypothetical protein
LTKNRQPFKSIFGKTDNSGSAFVSKIGNVLDIENFQTKFDQKVREPSKPILKNAVDYKKTKR